MKRDSKIRSVMMLMPGARVSNDIICACMSVGKPEYGKVVTSTAFNFLPRRTSKLPPRC